MNSKELTELIHQNTRIILPEFGAFLVKDSGDKGFNPANVSFSPFLRYNDGMLEVYVAKSRGISKEDASKEVHEFVEALKNELLEKGFYELEGLGSIRRDQRGSLSFSLLLSGEKINQSEIKSPESATPKIEGEKKVTQEPNNFDDKKDVWIEENKVLEDDPKEPKIRKITGAKAKVEKLTVTKRPLKVQKKEVVSEKESVSEIIPEPIPESKSDSKLEKEVVLIEQKKSDIKPLEPIDEKSEKIVISTLPGSDQEEEHVFSSPPESKITGKRKFSGLIYSGIAIIILVILVIVIRNYYFSPVVDSLNDTSSSITKSDNLINDKIDVKDKIEKPKDDIDKAFNEITKDDKATKEQIKKEKAQEELIKNTLIKNTEVKKSENRTDSGVKFYIIAGSFKKAEFAEKFLNELIRSGYNASIVVQPSGMNAVAIGSYSTREEANELMKKNKSKFTNLWILKK